MYSPASNSWTQKANIPGSVRRNAVAFNIGNYGYVGTGIDSTNASSGVTLKDFWRYDPTINEWSQRANYPGAGNNGVYFATAFVVDGKGYICGGKTGPSIYVYDLWQYDPSLDIWLQKADFPGGLRYKLASFALSDKAYVGLGIDLDIYRRDIWMYEPVNDSWTQKSDFPGGDIGAVATFTIGEQAFICTGEDGGLSKDLWEYDPGGDAWHIRANLPGEERRYAASFTIGNKAYVGTGDGTSGLKKSFYEYAPGLPVSTSNIEVHQITIFPNPCIDLISIKHNTSSISKLSVINFNGQVVMDISEPSPQFSVQSLSSGSYMLSVEFDDGTKSIESFYKL